jgi:hypothetical protein
MAHPCYLFLSYSNSIKITLKYSEGYLFTNGSEKRGDTSINPRFKTFIQCKKQIKFSYKEPVREAE